jgi:hypothetical protein
MQLAVDDRAGAWPARLSGLRRDRHAQGALAMLVQQTLGADPFDCALAIVPHRDRAEWTDPENLRLAVFLPLSRG